GSGTVEPSSVRRSRGRDRHVRIAFADAHVRVSAMSGVGLAGYLFLVLFCLVLPYLVFSASRKPRAAQAAKKPPPQRSRYFLSVVANQVFFVLIAIAVAHAPETRVPRAGSLTGLAVPAWSARARGPTRRRARRRRPARSSRRRRPG